VTEGARTASSLKKHRWDAKGNTRALQRKKLEREPSARENRRIWSSTGSHSFGRVVLERVFNVVESVMKT